MPRTTGVKLSTATRKRLRVLIQRLPPGSPRVGAPGNVARIAREVGLDPQSLRNILAGRRQPSERALQAICQAVGLVAKVTTAVEIGEA